MSIGDVTLEFENLNLNGEQQGIVGPPVVNNQNVAGGQPPAGAAEAREPATKRARDHLDDTTLRGRRLDKKARKASDAEDTESVPAEGTGSIPAEDTGSIPAEDTESVPAEDKKLPDDETISVRTDEVIVDELIGENDLLKDMNLSEVGDLTESAASVKTSVKSSRNSVQGDGTEDGMSVSSRVSRYSSRSREPGRRELIQLTDTLADLRGTPSDQITGDQKAVLQALMKIVEKERGLPIEQVTDVSLEVMRIMYVPPDKGVDVGAGAKPKVNQPAVRKPECNPEAQSDPLRGWEKVTDRKGAAAGGKPVVEPRKVKVTVAEAKATIPTGT